MFQRQIKALVGALVLLIACLTSSTSLATASSSTTNHSSAASSEDPLLAKGVLTDAEGKASKGLVQVSMFDHMGSGNFYLISSAKTDASGSFELRSAMSPRLRAVAANNNGYISFVITGITEKASTATFFSRKLSGNAWKGRDETKEFNVRASRKVEADDLQKVRDMIRTPQLSAEPRDDDNACYDLKGTSYQYTMIGELHAGPGVTGKFSYGVDQTADTEITVKVSGDGDNWSFGGEVHIGNSDESTVSRTRTGPYGYGIKSLFRYQKFSKSPWSGLYPACYPLPNHFIAPTRWEGGSLTGWNVNYLDGKCMSEHSQYDVLYERGDEWERKTRNFTWYGGAASVFGTGVNAKSGASTNVTLKLTFGNSRYFYRICGNNDYPSRALRVFWG